MPPALNGVESTDVNVESLGLKEAGRRIVESYQRSLEVKHRVKLPISIPIMTIGETKIVVERGTADQLLNQ